MEELPSYKSSSSSFLIGNDGNVYEGAGWNKVGAHTLGYNRKSIGIAFIGDFSGKNLEPGFFIRPNTYLNFVYR